MEDIKFHPYEKQVLVALNQLGGRGLPEKVAEIAGLDLISSNRASYWLVQKNLLKYEKKAKKIIRLSPLGKDTLKEGLPEKNLLIKINELGGVALFQDLKKFFPKKVLNVAMGWLRKNGWAIISKEDNQLKFKIIEPGKDALTKKTGVEEILGFIGDGVDLDSFMDKFKDKEFFISAIKKRHLVEIVKSVETTFVLTEKGLDIAKGISIKEEEEIAELDTEILKSGKWRKTKFRKYDIFSPPTEIHIGKKHPYLEILEKVRRFLLSLGFQEAEGPIVESEFWNCDILFMPQTHVAREIHDLFYIKHPYGATIQNRDILEKVKICHETGGLCGSKGWNYKYSFKKAQNLILRSQTTAVSARFLAKNKKAPLKMFCIDRNWRPEKLDPTHSFEFFQCEGIVMGEGLTFRDLLGLIEAIAKSLGIKEVKYKPGYFPFTEPSVEGFIKHPKLGWIEALPGGMFRPEVLEPLGIDYPVLAWGLGIDRLAMASLNITDIRDLFSKDLALLKNIPLG